MHLRIFQNVRRAAFSLVEMLVVITIIVVLVALITPALLGIVDSTNLKVATTSMADALNLARQSAITANRAVEVRFYKIPKDGADAATPASERVYRAVAIYRMDDTGPRQLGELIRLKGNVQCAEDASFSTLLHDTPSAEGQLGELGTNTEYEYRYVIFRADGSTSLPLTAPPAGTGDTWHVMLHNGNRTPDQARAGNFATIQLDPTTGRTRTTFPGR